MRRFFYSLALVLGAVTSVVGAVLPEDLPAQSHPPSAHRQIQDPSRWDQRSSIAVIELDTFTVEGHPEPFVAFLIVDLSSGDSIYLVGSKKRLYTFFRNIQFPTGLADRGIWAPQNEQSSTGDLWSESSSVHQTIGSEW